MSEHYYTARPETAHDEAVFTATLRGMAFTFITDSAVFSRERVDFGSALLIEAMQIEQSDTVLDLGCGYGPIGMTAAKLAPQGQVYMVDVNERAAALARRNLAENGVTNAEVRTGDGLDPVRGLTFDKVLTNPPIRAGKQTIYRMIEDAQAALKPGGSIYVVIQTKQGAPSMKKKLAELFSDVEDVERQAGYHVFRAVK
ncbi:MAG TPA: methyltransferase [Symbiobacteriaceae bacterium]|nr:methyltransferase [Symbiobacteriaceae bacterium]